MRDAKILFPARYIIISLNQSLRSTKVQKKICARQRIHVPIQAPEYIQKGARGGIPIRHTASKCNEATPLRKNRIATPVGFSL